MQSSRCNIAFIFAHRPTDAWSTPLSIVGEFNNRGWNSKIYTLFDIYDNYVESGIINLIKDYKENIFKPDIVIYMDWGRFDSQLLDKKNIPNAFWVMESGDDPQNFLKNSPKASRFNLVLTPDYQSHIKYKEQNNDVLWWTHFADTSIHKPSDGAFTMFDELPPVRSTRGPGGSALMDYLSSIIPYKFINKNGMIGTEYGDFLNSGRSKIVFQHSRWGEITRRIFEGMACGKLVITDRLSKDTHIDDLFEENEDIIYYDDVHDCISKINYYLSPEGNYEADRIALNGYNKVINNHTQIQRVEEVIKKYNIWRSQL